MVNSILRLEDVKERTGLSRSSIYALASKGSFPKPIALKSRAVGWRSKDIDAWIESLVSRKVA